MNWEPEHDAQLRALWGGGKSASAIAFEMTVGRSRNSVIGRLHRLGLTRHDRPATARSAAVVPKIAERRERTKPTPKPPAPKAEQQVKPAVAWPEPVIENTIPVGQRCTLMNLTDDTCRWPIGNPQEPDFHFCGGMARDGHPYCGFHMRIAYQPPMARRDRRPFRDDVA